MADGYTTIIARKKMAQARAGIKILPRIAGMAFGDGGIDLLGNPVPASETLRNELLRKNIESCEKISDTCYRYSCTLAEDELAGKAISELGLYDEEGDILGCKTFKAKIKDDDIEMCFRMDDQF